MKGVSHVQSRPKSAQNLHFSSLLRRERAKSLLKRPYAPSSKTSSRSTRVCSRCTTKVRRALLRRRPRCHGIALPMCADKDGEIDRHDFEGFYRDTLLAKGMSKEAADAETISTYQVPCVKRRVGLHAPTLRAHRVAKSLMLCSSRLMSTDQPRSPSKVLSAARAREREGERELLLDNGGCVQKFGGILTPAVCCPSTRRSLWQRTSSSRLGTSLKVHETSCSLWCDRRTVVVLTRNSLVCRKHENKAHSKGPEEGA